MQAKVAVVSMVALLLAAGPVRAEEQEAFRVIVNPRVDVTSISRSDLGKIFLKKKSEWPNGSKAKPVDQAPASKVREAFTRSIFNKSVAALRSYWRQKIFSGGGVPPPETGNDAEALAYVVSTAGAVGYVASDASTTGAKLLKLTD